MPRIRDKVDQGKADDDVELGDSTPLKDIGNLPGSLPRRSHTGLLHAAAVIAQPFLGRGSPSRRRGFCLITAVVLSLLMECGVLLIFSEVQKDYMTALENKKAELFYQGLWSVAVLIVIALPIIGMHTYMQGSLEVEWRAAITRSMAQCYLSGSCTSGQGAFYKLHMDGTLDNPDQRMCQDVADLVSTGLHLSVDILGSIIRVLGFVMVLYKISPRVCLGIFFYSAASTGGGVLGFGLRLFRYQSRITQQEATLRYSLIRVRENAESIAFFKGGPTEWTKFQEMFAQLVDTIYGKIRQLTGFHMFSFIVKFSTFAIPVLLVGPAYMRGEAEFGQIAQADFAFQMIFEGLMLITSKVPELSNMAVQVSRLCALDEVLQDEASKASKALHASTLGVASELGSSIALYERTNEETDATLEVSGMTLMTPPRRGAPQQTVVSELSFQLKSGASLLIVGESGIGKSSLLRAIAGLWSDGCGSVSRCGGSTVFFMPQRPYMCLGTLHEQLLYPHHDIHSFAAEKMGEALIEVNLGYLLERHGLDTVRDWASILSLGEQQRINFARVLLQPDLQLALLDEGTSACDPESEGRLYAALQRKVKSYVSVGHRPGLRRYHTHTLLLQRAKGGSLQPSQSTEQPVSTMHSYFSMAEFENLGLPT